MVYFFECRLVTANSCRCDPERCNVYKRFHRLLYLIFNKLKYNIIVLSKKQLINCNS